MFHILTSILIAGVSLILALITHPAWGEQKIPDANLKVTVQQKEEGKLNPALHFQELLCFNGDCSLTSVTLNSCRPSPVSNGMASPIVIERTTTTGGNLKVTNEGNTLVAVETSSDIGGNYVSTHRFTYEKTREDRMAMKLIGYSGGYVKNSDIVQRVVIVEFVPLKGVYKEIQKLDCPLGLPGVATLND